VLVRFLARTSPIRPSPADIKAIANALTQIWPEHFEGPASLQLVPGAGLHLAMQKRYFVSNGFFDAPSLLLLPDVLEIHMFRKINGAVLEDASADLWVSDISSLHKVRSVFLKLQEVIPNYRYFRTAQSFKMDYGMYNGEERQQILRMLCGRSSPEIGEFRVTLTRYHSEGGTLYNYHCNTGYTLINLANPLTIDVQIDVNNRDMSTSLDPHNLEAIWAHGREMRNRLLEELFPDESA
jgi:hypothetical protein